MLVFVGRAAVAYILAMSVNALRLIAASLSALLLLALPQALSQGLGLSIQDKAPASLSALHQAKVVRPPSIARAADRRSDLGDGPQAALAPATIVVLVIGEADASLLRLWHQSPFWPRSGHARDPPALV